MTPLVTQISWTNHLLIMSGSKSAEERHCYLLLCAKKHHSKRELERQINSAYYERYRLSMQKPASRAVPRSIRRSMSPMLIAEYTLYLPDKNLLQNKLRELTELALECKEEDEKGESL